MESLYQGGSLLSLFFKKNPKLFSNCLKVIDEINNDLGFVLVSKKEISFDIILPFLIDEISTKDSFRLSYILQLNREIVDYYNKGNNNVIKLISLLESKTDISPLSFDEYQIINLNERKLDNLNIRKSYRRSTKRVYYRLSNLNPFINKNIRNQIKDFSAFLLFDDDVFDLQQDLKVSKNTILIQYLTEGKTLKKAIKKMTKVTSKDDTIFNDFFNIFLKIYKYD